ncbi:MAG: hypothetical protein UU31_C0002G0069 [Candidatus Uhrbacteria bacterium GW2011_GWA2_41_10]|nr:MAG: hypothetical protein UU31_C0002G0069 [Candidatus Uhrbacteria bacterium GW2011_GWA2_41_10]
MRLRKTAMALGVFVFVGILMVLGTRDVYAQINSASVNAVGSASGLSTQELTILIARIIRAALGVLGIVFVALIVYAGYLYMISSGDPVKTANAKKIIKSAAIGLVIIFASYSIASYVLGRLLAAAGLAGTTTTTAAPYSEPLSGSLGSGMIENHYPGRNAIDIPRNTRIMITFKEPMNPDSFVKDDDKDPATTDDMNTDNLLIYPTDSVNGSEGVEAKDVALASTAVAVSYTEDLRTFVFDPIDLLGNALEDTNYTVKIQPDSLKADGTAVFSGAYAEGYEWSFEVSTEVDLTPPKVVSAIPVSSDNPYDRNVTIQITFNEAMDPVAVSGTYDPNQEKTFSNIEIVATPEGETKNNVYGSFLISNGYKTVEFTSFDACSKDPCGDTIYCLPALANIEVQAHAAGLSTDPPQASMIGGLFDGLADAAGNSLDGDGDGTAEGTGVSLDDYQWNFQTSDAINDDVPEIISLSPGIREENVDLNTQVKVTFNMLMQSSSLNSDAIRLIPDQVQELWYTLSQMSLNSNFQPANVEENPVYTQAMVDHASFWESDETQGIFYNYYPVISNDVKSVYQICMYPSYGPSNSESFSSCATTLQPYCCDGLPSNKACTTNKGTTLGD